MQEISKKDIYNLGILEKFVEKIDANFKELERAKSAVSIYEEFNSISNMTESLHYQMDFLGGVDGNGGVSPNDPSAIGYAYIGFNAISQSKIINSKNSFPLGVGRAYSLRFRVKINQSNYSHNIAMGFWDAYDNSGYNGAYFRFTGNEIHTWTQGGTVNVNDQGADDLKVVFAENQWYNMRIDVNADCTQIDYFIDDVRIKTVTNPIYLPKFRPYEEEGANLNTENFVRATFFMRGPSGNPVVNTMLYIDYINLLVY